VSPGSAAACTLVVSASRDFDATMCYAMGIPADLAYEVERRPFHVTRDGKGKPIAGIFS